MKKKIYPVWICRDCGLRASGNKSFLVSCYHNGKCDICKEYKAVTEPRDFFYPKFKEE